MRILFLSPRQALPARSGAKQREYQFLRALGKSAELSYVYFAEPGSPPLTTEDLPFCREVVGIPKPPAYTLAKTAMGVLGRWPLPILNYSDSKMSAAVDRLISVRDFDFMHLESIHMIRYALAAAARKPALKVVYNWHNIESEAMRRYSVSTRSRVRRWYAEHTADRLATLERGILQSAYGHIVCSEREGEQLRRIAPAARIKVAENGVDAAHFAGAEGGTPASARIVFVGLMNYFPNSEAAVFFATLVWPDIRRSLTGAELTIVGAEPGLEVLALAQLPGVSVTGTVPDVRPFYRGALAAVVPLRTGGGTRLKILEAMAAGVPVISTPFGAEGLEVVDGENILMASPDDTKSWVERLVSLAASPALRAQLTNSGLRLVRERYDWEIIGSRLRGIYGEWFSGL